MIVAFLRERNLLDALRAAASPEEDLIFGTEEGLDAVFHGFPRLIVLREHGDYPFAPYRGLPDVPVLRIGAEGGPTVAGWKGTGAPPMSRLGDFVNEVARSGTWVDEIFRNLTTVVGNSLPGAFRGYCRRVLEYPARYDDLHAVAGLTGMSRGALKARFRRQGLRSPAEHIRWLRVLATAQVLADPGVTTGEAAYRLGYTSNGNLSRAVQAVAGMNPAEFRSAAARSAVLVGFARRFVMDTQVLARWSRFDTVFLRPHVA